MLFCLLSTAVAGQGQVAENHGEISVDHALAGLYSLGDVSEIQTITGQSSATYSTDQRLMEKPAGIDCVEELPAKMELQLHEAPVLGAIAELSLVVVPEADAQNAEIRIVLPEGFSLFSGSLHWCGKLSRNVTVQMNVFIRAELVGIWRIEAIATGKSSGGYHKICSTHCYVHVAEKEAHILGSALENSAKIDVTKLDDGGDQKRLITLLSSGTISVYGYWYYKNEFGISMPARYAKVELWNDSATGDVLLATTSVQSNGYYEFTAVETDNETLALYVKLFCQTSEYQIVRVYDPDFVIYWSQTNVHNVTEEYLNMGAWLVQGDQRECWKIYDNIVDGYFWLLNKTGWNRSEVYARLTGSMGFSLSLGDGMIIFPGDGWIRETVLHEYGHCINYAARGGSFPPSNYEENEHYLDTEADLGWAFREGWAEFFTCAVDNNPSLETTTYADGPFGHGDSGDWDGDYVEGAVAQVFWDIFDGEKSYDYPTWDLERYGDYISNEFDKLWDIFLNHDPNSIHSFWYWWSPKDARIWEIFRHARINESRNIVVMNVSSSQESALVGEVIQFNVTVKNQGQTVENLNITVVASSLLIGSFENITLESHESETFAFNWNTTEITRGIYTIFARAVIFPEDLNTTDNVNAENIVTILLPGQAGPGDVYTDGVVDIFDMVTVAREFGSPPPPIENPNADINHDNAVDIFDIAVIALHFGETE